MTLNSYTTTTIEIYFYWPSIGKFTHFPSNITINNSIVSRAKVSNFNVIQKSKLVKSDTFLDLLALNDKDLILSFINWADLINGENGFKFSDMMYLMKDKEFFKRITVILWNRWIFNREIWEFGFYHKIDIIVSELI